MPADWTQALSSRLDQLRLRPERKLEIEAEVSQHLDDHVEALMNRGLDRDAARRQALADLDAPGLLAERLAKVLTPSPYALPPPGAPARGRWFSARWLDIRHATRSLLRTPAFTITVVVTMALTIGPTTALLSVGNRILWRPVPSVVDADRLGIVMFGRWDADGNGVRPFRVSPQNIADLVAGSRTLQAFAGTQEGSDSVTVEGQPAEVTGVAHADASLFETLGLRPAAGRFFAPSEDVLPYGSLVAVLGEGFARRAFGTPDGAIGKSILLNGRRLEVIGVAPAAFRGIEPFSAVDLWYPGAAYRQVHHFRTIPSPSRREGTFYTFVTRLKPRATFDEAQAELDVLASNLADRHPQDNELLKGGRARLFPGLGPRPLARDQYHTLVERLLWIGAALVVLGVANMTNLLIFRSVRRDRESAVRLALGAGRARLLHLCLTESCLLAVAGAVVGLGLALGLKQLLVSLVLPGVMGTTVELAVPLDRWVLGTTLVVSVVTGLAAGLIPAWLSATRTVAAGLAQAGVRTTPRGRRLRAGFASLQLAVSLSLVVGAVLMVSSLRGLLAVDLGFDARGVSLHNLDLGSLGYAPPRALQYVRDLRDVLASSRAVDAVSFSLGYPLGSVWVHHVPAPGARSGEQLELRMTGVSEDYFTVLGIPILRGRAFTKEEAFAAGAMSGNGVIVSESLAGRLFGTSDPIGQTFFMEHGSVKHPVVIGVVQDVKADIDSGEPELSVYEPFARSEPLIPRPNILVKSTLGARGATELLRAAGARIDPTAPFSGNWLLQEQIDRRLAHRRVFAWVLSLLGGLGFALAAVGLYGLLSQSVTERTREFGIRLAIGATGRQVSTLVFRQAGLIAGIGGVAGLGLAVLGAGLLESQLWGVTGRDPYVYGAATLALVAVVFVAAAVPARLATRVQPVETLRME